MGCARALTRRLRWTPAGCWPAYKPKTIDQQQKQLLAMTEPANCFKSSSASKHTPVIRLRGATSEPKPNRPACDSIAVRTILSFLRAA